MQKLLFTLALITTITGCAAVVDKPTLTMETRKSPEQFAACVMPKLQQNAMHPTLSQAQRSYKIVVSSPVSTDHVIEAYKAPSGGKIFVYERSLLTSGVEQTAKDCA